MGLKIKVLEGYCARLLSRSGHAFKNHIWAYEGLIDPSFDEELKMLFFNGGTQDYVVFLMVIFFFFPDCFLLCFSGKRWRENRTTCDSPSGC